jgi:spore maturation protein CgeB
VRIAIPNFCVPDTFLDNVAFTLRAMGHEVFTRSDISVRIAFSRVRRRLLGVGAGLFPNRVPGHERWLLRLTKEHRIDLVLALTQSISEQTLSEVKQRGVQARVAWWGDTPRNMQKMGLLTEEWDTLFLKDADTVEKYRGIGLNAHLLHEAMNPAWHRPIGSIRRDVIVVAGSMYGFRQFLVRKLARAGVPMALYGPAPPLWALPEVKRSHTGKYIVREKKSEVFGAGAACLNFSPESEGNSLNCRAFEIAGAGGLQVYEYRPVIEQCFEPGREILVYRTFDELVDLIIRARREPTQFEAVREAGARRAHAEHTYRQRLEKLLAISLGHRGENRVA